MRLASFSVFLWLALAQYASAYDVPTHQQLGLRAAELAMGLHEALVRDLGFPQGRETLVGNGASRARIVNVISDGAGEEDRPFWRVRHHFHNPLASWDLAG